MSDYFNYFDNLNPERDVYDRAAYEIVQQKGIPLKYLKRTLFDEDVFFGEDPMSQFNSFVDVKMYLSSYDDFGGSGDLFSKFGLQVEDTITLECTIAEFNALMGNPPLQGDLLYFTFNETLFEITNVENDRSNFFFLGKTNIYKITAKVWDYSGETMNTGIEDIDNLNNIDFVTDVDDNTSVDDEILDIIDFDEEDPFA